MRPSGSPGTGFSWGIQLSATYLASVAKTGPRYSVIGRKAYYLISELDDWARESLGLEVESG